MAAAKAQLSPAFCPISCIELPTVSICLTHAVCQMRFPFSNIFLKMEPLIENAKRSPEYFQILKGNVCFNHIAAFEVWTRFSCCVYGMTMETGWKGIVQASMSATGRRTPKMILVEHHFVGWQQLPAFASIFCHVLLVKTRRAKFIQIQGKRMIWEPLRRYESNRFFMITYGICLHSSGWGLAKVPQPQVFDDLRPGRLRGIDIFEPRVSQILLAAFSGMFSHFPPVKSTSAKIYSKWKFFYLDSLGYQRLG